MPVIIKKRDILKRVYFIIKKIQSQQGQTMQGALTSKSDSMGGIFDRFINSVSEDIVFNQFIIPKITTMKKVEIINDFYIYNPSKKGAGIAPDIIGIKVNEKNIPFVEFNEKWIPIDGKPQIEVKTFKAKDQMVSLRNQEYDSQYIVLVDLRLRIDYLVPFLDSNLLNSDVLKSMKIDDRIFIKKDTLNKIKPVTNIDFSDEEIGLLDLITITSGSDILRQATLCQSGVGPKRIKEIRKRKVMKRSTTNLKLSDFALISPRIGSIYEFNKAWYNKTNTNISKTIYLDFSATDLANIKIVAFNKNSVVIKASSQGCSINGISLDNVGQYIVEFATLERDSNKSEEYFMQKECTKYLTNHMDNLINSLKKIID
jgi:hypothetical protein